MRYRLRTLLFLMAVLPPVIAFFALRAGILIVLLCFYPLAIVGVVAVIRVIYEMREKWIEHQANLAGKKRRAEALEPWAITIPKS